eukprot:4699154-Pyramimonas_sp.AAC.1
MTGRGGGRLTAAVAAEGSTSASPRALASWLSLARGVLAQGRRGEGDCRARSKSWRTRNEEEETTKQEEEEEE